MSKTTLFILKLFIALHLIIVLADNHSFAQTSTKCRLGEFSDTGNEPCTPSPPGSYVDIIGARFPTPASPGTFVPNAGAASATLAPIGFYVPSSGATEPSPAPIGSYVDIIGARAPIPAPIGFYVDTTGATSPTPAEPGTYVPNVGATSATPAPIGFFVPSSGATEPTPAEPGTYVPNVGAVSAIPAPLGFYVPSFGASEAIAAPIGFYVSGTGAASPTACPGGSISFGASRACRSGLISVNDPNVVGPDFRSNFGTHGDIDFGMLEAGRLKQVTFVAENASSDLNMGDLLTDLQLNSILFTGADAHLFSSFDFVAGSVLRELESYAFTIDVMPTIAQTIDAVLEIRTDQYAATGEDGAVFTFNLSGVVNDTNSVFAPATIGLFFGSLLIVVMRKRKIG